MSKGQSIIKENTIMPGPTDIEKENLEAHVELCAERYKQLETRLSSIEKKVANLQDTIEKSSLNTIKVLIGTAGTVIVGMLSMLAVIITKMP
jgi:tetrahydromethanopterin S-methyltransferase subunit G